MASMGQGYGSECHLIRFLGRHRALLNQRIIATTGATKVEWIDYPFVPAAPWKDGEWTGLGFLPDSSPALEPWTKFWPQKGNPPNWDAVGRITINGEDSWLLVEAKAHTAEIGSTCQASEAGGLARITESLRTVSADLGASSDADWLRGYYQYANRIAVLWHLMTHGEPARLLFIYFTGDNFPSGDRDCPKDEAGWQVALEAQEKHIGLPKQHKLADRIHKVFVTVCP